MLEKTPEQIAAEKKAKREAERERQRAQDEARRVEQAPPRNDTRPAEPAAAAQPAKPRSALSLLGLWVSIAIQGTYVLGFLLSLRDAWLIGLVTGAIWVANIYQRKAGWMRFFIALIAGSGLSAVLRKMLA